ncbi:hypothetical protein ACJW30_12G160300 [Castanea mollissima]
MKNRATAPPLEVRSVQSPLTASEIGSAPAQSLIGNRRPSSHRRRRSVQLQSSRSRSASSDIVAPGLIASETEISPVPVAVAQSSSPSQFALAHRRRRDGDRPRCGIEVKNHRDCNL